MLFWELVEEETQLLIILFKKKLGLRCLAIHLNMDLEIQ